MLDEDRAGTVLKVQGEAVLVEWDDTQSGLQLTVRDVLDSASEQMDWQDK